MLCEIKPFPFTKIAKNTKKNIEKGDYPMGGKFFLAGVVLVAVLAAMRAVAAEPDGDEIVAKVDAELYGNTGRYLADLTMIRPGEEPRTSRIQVYIKGTDKVLVRYLAPAREKGMGYLRVGEDEWLYLPNAGRSIRVSGRQNLQGTDLSNDDVLKVHLALEYQARIAGEEEIEGAPCWVLELAAREQSAAYGRLKYWVRKADFLPARTEYYAFSGRLLKTMTYAEIKEIGGRVRPTRMVIESGLREGYRTLFVILEADYRTPLGDNLFTRLYLEKGK